MIKRICDKCGESNKIKTYTLPRFEEKTAYGAKGKSAIIKFDMYNDEGTIDLCESCAVKFAREIEFFILKNLEEEGLNGTK